MDVYIHRGLMLAGPAVRIRLAGFWKLRWLRVTGLVTPAGCML